VGRRGRRDRRAGLVLLGPSIALRPRFECARLLAGAFALAALLPGCALVVPQTMRLYDEWPASLPPHAMLDGVPFFAQEEYQCGPAALAMALDYAGAGLTPEALASEVYLPGRHGSLQADMAAAPRRHGIVSYRLAPRFEDTLREVAAGNPVVVLQDYGVWPIHLWHYAVVIGYDRREKSVTLRSGLRPALTMPLAVMEYLWKESDYWAIVALAPGRIPATATRKEYLDAVRAMARVGADEAAARAYEGLLARWPGDEVASIGLGEARYAQHRLGAAERAFRAGLARHPRSVPLMNDLAQALSDQGRDEEALALIERAAASPGPYSEAVRATRATVTARWKSREAAARATASGAKRWRRASPAARRRDRAAW
jgi:hypothetical protein